MQTCVRSAVLTAQPRSAALKAQRASRVAVRAMASAAEPKYDIAVKAVGGKLADCECAAPSGGGPVLPPGICFLTSVLVLGSDQR